MIKLKKDFPKMTFRPSEKSLKVFKRKCMLMRIKDEYTTQDKVLIELMDMFNSGKIKMGWES